MASHTNLLRDHHQRNLDWGGCFNVRDLGGLPTTDGTATRWGALVRADALSGLSEAGWRALSEHGVCTVIDLRNDDELGGDAAPRPEHVTTVHIPLDVSEDREFWNVWQTGPQFGTPLYYRPHLDRFPERSASVELLSTLDVEAHLRDAGLTETHLVALRQRLIGSSRHASQAASSTAPTSMRTPADSSDTNSMPA